MQNVADFSKLQEIYRSEKTVVYTGIDNRTGQKISLKILNDDFPSVGFIAQFNGEAELSQQFTLKGVRKILEKRKINNRYALVMEHVDGLSWRELIDKGMVDLPIFFPLAIRVCDVLSGFHKQGIIHKDINPRNLLCNGAMEVWVIDFGIASVLKKETQKFEAPEKLEGTLAYISPEQTGRMNHSIDSRSDLYSLGITLYEMLVGELPFDATDPIELVHSHIAKMPPNLCEKRPDLPAILEDIVMKLLAKNIEERYQTAEGLKQDLMQCWETWQTVGAEAVQALSFAVGSNDVKTDFCIPEKLYGRNAEREMLLEAFHSAEMGGTGFVLVGGHSGIGKTSLIRELYQPVTAKRSYFLAGKFEQFQRDIPYSAIVQAINGFVQQLLGESDRRLAHWKHEIMDVLGENAGVLTEVIPSLELIIGKQPVPISLPPLESQNRFNRVFQRFFKHLSTPKHALVIFIDDWQWADQQSLHFLQHLVTAIGLKHLLFIAAYRSNEVSPVHPFVATVNAIREADVPTVSVELEELALEHIEALLQDTLHASQQEIASLAKLIKAKTSGNPFFVSQFLQNMYDDSYITFDVAHKKWRWDITVINKLPISDNVLDLMTTRLNALPTETLEVLKLASCIGNQFPLKLLSELAGKTPLAVRHALSEALKQGFIVPHQGNQYAIDDENQDSQVYFKFLHDRVEQAANQFLSREGYTETQWKIGKLILDNATEAHIQEGIFDIVNYLNNGRTYADKDSIKRLADLNHQAGKKAKRSTAYTTAKLLFGIALEGFGDTFWTDDYAKAFDLHKELAEALFLQGNFEESDTYLALCLEKAETKYEKAEIYKIKIAQLSGQGKYAEALQIAIDAVQVFDIDLPNLNEKAKMSEATGTEIGLFMEYISQHDNDIDVLGKLPACTNPDIIKGMELLGFALDCAAITVPAAFALIAMKMNNLTIAHGISPLSTVSFTFTSLVYGSGFKDFKNAHKISRLGRVLAEQRADTVQLLAKVYHIHAYHAYTELPLAEAGAYNEKAYKTGLEVGDFVYASYALGAEPRFFYPINIKNALDKTQNALTFFYKTNNVPMQIVMKMYMGFAKCMVGETKALNSFDNDVFSEEGYSEALEKSAPLLFALYKRYKIQALTILDFHEDALKLVYERAIWISIVGGLDVGWRSEYYLFIGLTVASLYHKCLEERNKKGIETYKKEIENEITQLQAQINTTEATEEQKQTIDELNYALYVLEHKLEPAKYVEVLQECIDELQVLLDCSDNFLAQHSLLYAEKARIEGNKYEAMEAYDEAIEAATKTDMPQYIALAAERAGIYYIYEPKHNKKDVAKVYLQKALYAYEVWGATAKVEQIRSKYKEFIGLRKGTRTTNTLGLITSVKQVSLASSYGDNALDLLSIMKASQAISQEIKLESLLRTMVLVLMENAGADRALILQERNSALFVVAEAHLHAQEVAIMRPEPLSKEDRNRLALSVILHVYRTHESVTLHNAKKDKQFSIDSYIQQGKVKSLLCVPIVHQSEIRAVIYMEHSQIEGVFTRERVEILNMLSSQVAISMENSLLYNNMEEKVAKRTKELKEQKELVEHKNANIIASITYAQRIQQAILPLPESIERLIPQHFVLFQPKDIVSGDFYYLQEKDEKVVLAAIDCTGHGVPGAFMSMLGSETLNEIIQNKGILSPDQILNELHKSIRKALKQKETDNRDGMDLSMIVWDKANQEVHFAGAKNSLIYIQNGELKQIKGNIFPIGGEQKEANRVFTKHTIALLSDSPTSFYLFSDGYQDQFGGEHNKKFSMGQMKTLFLEIHQQDMSKQQERLKKVLQKWMNKGKESQIDDVLLIGCRL